MDAPIEMPAESSEELLCLIDDEGRFAALSPPLQRIFGCSAAEILGEPAADWAHADDVAQSFFVQSRLAEWLAAPVPRSFECRMRNAEGVYRHFCWVIVQRVTTSPQRPAAWLIARDPTPIASADERLQAVFESAPSAMVLVDCDGRIVMANGEACRLFGYDAAELKGEPVEVLVPERSRQAHVASRRGFHDNPARRPMGAGRDLMGRRRDGSEIPIEIGLTPLPTADGVHYLSAIVDLTERKRYERELVAQKLAVQRANEDLQRIATADAVTALKNRRAFDEQLQNHGTLAQRTGRPLSVILLDVDRFKSYNDSHGHPAGDALLASMGRVILQTVRLSDVPARYGGDEFAVLLPATDQIGALGVAERLRQRFAGVSRDDREVSASFGVATIRFGSSQRPDFDLRSSLVQLVGGADRALYVAKRSGRNQVVAEPVRVID